jgi:Tol biopolymer transport system component
MSSWILVLALLGQRPAAGPSPEELASEARHLKNTRQVTYGFAKAGEGYFSPDGREIIFQATPHLEPELFHSPAPDEEGYQIYAAMLEPGARPWRVSTGKGRCTCAYFHPTRKKVLFGSTHLAPSSAVEEPKGPAYSRSERYRWEFPESMDIFEANPDGTDLIRLTDSPGYDAEASYSADGTRIVFTSFRDGDAEIYIMNADGTNPKRITRSPGYDGGPFFSPDGKWIVYRSDRKGNDLLQIYINNTEGTNERALTQNDFVNWGPYFHPDGKHIAYATSRHGHANYEIYLMNIENRKEVRLTHREGFDGLPVFSPDGTKLMWTSSGRSADKKSQLFIADFTMPPDSEFQIMADPPVFSPTSPTPAGASRP